MKYILWKKNSLSLLIGNKSDLDDRRQVEESAAAQFAAEKGLAYIETSAIDSANIREAFLTLVKPRLRLNRAASTASSWSITLNKSFLILLSEMTPTNMIILGCPKLKYENCF